MAERCFGVVIEGLFLPDTARPVAFTSAASDLLLNTIEGLGALFPATYLHAEEALAERNGSIDTSIDPFRVRESYGSFNLRMVATDRIGSAIFKKAHRSVGKLDVELTKVATTVDFNVTGLDLAPAMIDDGVNQYNVVWIGTEAILVPIGSEVGIASGIYAGCIRGALATEAGLHEVGTYVWNQMPYWNGRRIWLFDAELERTPRVRLRDFGRINSGFEQDNGSILIRGNSHLSSLDQRLCNLKPYRLPDAQNGLEYISSDDFLTGYGFGGRFVEDNHGFNIRKRFRTTTALLPNYDAAWVQNGEHLQYFDRRDFTNIYRSRNANGLLNSALTVQDESDKKTDADHINFMFCIVNPKFDTWLQDGIKGEVRRPNPTPMVGTSFGPTRFFGATEGFDDLTINTDFKDIYKYHPVAICAALMMSTNSVTTNPDEFDLFHPNWSLGIRSSFSASSIAAIHDLIIANPWDQIQYLAMGKDGAPVRLMEEIRTILQTYGYRVCVDNEGYLTFSKAKLIDVEERGATLSNSITAVASQLLNFQDGSAATSPKVFGKYGETPFFDGNTVEITTVLEGTYPAVSQLDENELSINANTIAELGELRAQLESRALLMDYQTPRLKVRVAGDSGADIGLGQWVNLQDLPLRSAWLFDRNGNRVATLNSTTEVKWVGQVVGRRYLISENAYELEMFFINEEVIRWRAPSARISGAPQTSQNRIGIEPGTAFGNGDDDLSRFTVSDEISIIREDGTWVTTTPLTISAIGADYIEISGTNVTSFNVGDYYVELAYLRTSTANGYLNNTVITGVDRAYAFLGSDNQGELGTAAITADQYG